MELQHFDVEQGVSLDDHPSSDNILPAITVSEQNGHSGAERATGMRQGTHTKLHGPSSPVRSPLSPKLPPIKSEAEIEYGKNGLLSQHPRTKHSNKHGTKYHSK